MGRTTPPTPKQGLPVVTFADRVSIHFNGEEIRMVHYPHGHTDGDSVIFFGGSKVVHMGDDYFSGRFPFAAREPRGAKRFPMLAATAARRRPASVAWCTLYGL